MTVQYRVAFYRDVLNTGKALHDRFRWPYVPVRVSAAAGVLRLWVWNPKVERLSLSSLRLLFVVRDSTLRLAVAQWVEALGLQAGRPRVRVSVFSFWIFN